MLFCQVKKIGTPFESNIIKNIKIMENSNLLTTNFFDSFFSDDFLSKKTPKVNIKQSDTEYNVEMYAPALKKSDFNISIDNGILTVESDYTNEVEKEEDNYIRKEYFKSSFKRQFDVGNDVNAEDIKAKYEDGVLKISLPKSEKKYTKQIEIT